MSVALSSGWSSYIVDMCVNSYRRYGYPSPDFSTFYLPVSPGVLIIEINKVRKEDEN